MTATEALNEHCTTSYNEVTGEEMIDATKDSVVIAMESYASIRVANSLEALSMLTDSEIREYIENHLNNSN